MIRIRHISLPPGLTALARRGPGDELNVYVSDSLPAPRQRAAVRVALRAARGRGWRAVPLPIGAAGLLPALARGGLRRAGHVLRGYSVVWGTTAAVLGAALAVVYVAVVPHGHPATHIAEPPAGVTVQPPAAVPRGHVSTPARNMRATHRLPSGHSAPAANQTGSPATGGHVGSGTLTAGHGAHPGTPPASPPAPGPSTSPTPHPSPSPSPSSAPPGPRGRHCIINLLGIKVCLG